MCQLHLLLWFVTGVVACLTYGLSLGCFWVSFILTEALLPPSHPYPPLISATPDITAMPVKASQNQAAQTISDA